MTPPRHPTLGLLLLTPRGHPATLQAFALAQEAAERHTSVRVYCLHEGVTCVDSPELQSLRHRGVLLAACAYSAEQRGVPISDRAVFAGLLLLAQIIAHADTFKSFSPNQPPHPPPSPPLSVRSAPEPPGRRPVLVRLHDDLRTPGLAAEGLRVAAGLAAHPMLEVTLLLPPNPPATSTSPDRLAPDSNLAQQHLDLLLASQGRVLLPAEAPDSRDCWPFLDLPQAKSHVEVATAPPPFATLDF